MNAKTANSLGRKLFLAFAIGTTGLLAGCSTCYHCRQDCPYGYDTSPGLYDKLVLGWMPDFLTLRSSGQSHGTAAQAHCHAATETHVILEAEADKVHLPDVLAPSDTPARIPDEQEY